MSGAPVLRYSRMRPRDIISNAEMAAECIADVHDLPIENVRTVLANGKLLAAAEQAGLSCSSPPTSIRY